MDMQSNRVALGLVATVDGAVVWSVGEEGGGGGGS